MTARRAPPIRALAVIGRPRPAWLGPAAALFGVGWGANQFSSLLLAYRQHSHLSAESVDALFGIYAIGLIPALLVGGPVSDRHGRRLVVPVVGASAVATGVLMLGATAGLPALYAGRFLAGVVSGLAFAPGTAWVKELSSGAGPDGAGADAAGGDRVAGDAAAGDTAAGDPAGSDTAGARRAAVALSAGFGCGPLVAGVLAQWAPAPAVVPYLAHLGVVAVVGALVARTPETVRSPPTVATAPPDARREGARPRFATAAAPMAPWVFGAASISFAVLPAVVTRRTRHYEVAFAAAVAGVTLLVGVLVQPYARRIDVWREGAGIRAGLALVVTGLLLGAEASASGQPLVVLAAAVALGGGYGTCLVSGLLEVQRIADPGRLAGLTAVFYAFTYVGFAAPLIVSALSGVADTTDVLLGASALCGLTLAAISTRAGVGRRPKG